MVFEPEIFTRAQAEARLAELGWAWDPAMGLWRKGDDLARLAHFPHYADPKPDQGTKWFLQQPRNQFGIVNLIQILPVTD